MKRSSIIKHQGLGSGSVSIMKNYEIVLIEWVDSKGMDRWEYLDEIEPMPRFIHTWQRAANDI